MQLPPSPWSFQPHPLAWILAVVAAVLYAWAVRRDRYRATRREVAAFVGALVAALAVLIWPVADLASRWSLTALVLQRLVLLLAVPAFLLLGLPRSLLARLTRPATVDEVLRSVSRPVVAVIIVTVVSVGTLTSGAVSLQASSPVGRAALDLVLVLAGVVLWCPVLTRVPGTERPSPLGRAGYLIVQSLVPSFLAVVWIFAHHPLYSSFAHTMPGLGITPIADQRIAGFLAKLGTLAVLWTVAFVIIARAQDGSEEDSSDDPLTVVDIERQAERAARAERHSD